MSECLNCEILLSCFRLAQKDVPSVSKNFSGDEYQPATKLSNWDIMLECSPDYHADPNNTGDSVGCFLKLMHSDSFGPQFRLYEENEEIVVLDHYPVTLEVENYPSHGEDRETKTEFRTPLANPDYQKAIQDYLWSEIDVYIKKLKRERYHFGPAK